MQQWRPSAAKNKQINICAGIFCILQIQIILNYNIYVTLSSMLPHSDEPALHHLFVCFFNIRDKNKSKCKLSRNNNWKMTHKHIRPIYFHFVNQTWFALLANWALNKKIIKNLMRLWKSHVQFYSLNWESICEKDYFTSFHSEN